jgi:hypothetical protein
VLRSILEDPECDDICELLYRATGGNWRILDTFLRDKSNTDSNHLSPTARLQLFIRTIYNVQINDITKFFIELILKKFSNQYAVMDTFAALPISKEELVNTVRKCIENPKEALITPTEAVLSQLKMFEKNLDRLALDQVDELNISYTGQTHGVLVNFTKKILFDFIIANASQIPIEDLRVLMAITSPDTASSAGKPHEKLTLKILLEHSADLIGKLVPINSERKSLQPFPLFKNKQHLNGTKFGDKLLPHLVLSNTGALYVDEKEVKLDEIIDTLFTLSRETQKGQGIQDIGADDFFIRKIKLENEELQHHRKYHFPECDIHSTQNDLVLFEMDKNGNPFIFELILDQRKSGSRQLHLMSIHNAFQRVANILIDGKECKISGIGKKYRLSRVLSTLNPLQQKFYSKKTPPITPTSYENLHLKPNIDLSQNTLHYAFPHIFFLDRSALSAIYGCGKYGVVLRYFEKTRDFYHLSKPSAENLFANDTSVVLSVLK